MIKNPSDEHGNIIFVPGALCVDVPAHREAMHQHLLRLAGVDVRYARWMAGTMGEKYEEWHHDQLVRLDADLKSRGVPIPKLFREPASKLPPLVEGRRAFLPRESLIDFLKREYPESFEHRCLHGC